LRLGESDRAAAFLGLPIDEMAFVVEMVVD
jgi:hypothetical protein